MYLMVALHNLAVHKSQHIWLATYTYSHKYRSVLYFLIERFGGKTRNGYLLMEWDIWMTSIVFIWPHVRFDDINVGLNTEKQKQRER